jgi:hypothetical protein
VEVCRRIREQKQLPYIYIILTAKNTAEELDGSGRRRLP